MMTLPSGPIRVLVIDDDPFVLDSLRMALEASGHAVTQANTGQAGIDAFAAAQAQMPFEVVLTDLAMPNVGGLQVARAVKAIAPTTPVILMSGWGQSAGEGDPAVDLVLEKPTRLAALRQALDLARPGSA